MAEGAKEAFCLVDSQIHDDSLPNFGLFPRNRNCEGVNVGWLDLYDKSFPNQWIDITEVPRGHYWLEAEVDGAGNVLESNDDNNVKRVKVFLNSNLLRPYATDTDGNNVTDAVDVQLVINAALGMGISLATDINGDGAVDAVDVQLVINGALGL